MRPPPAGPAGERAPRESPRESIAESSGRNEALAFDAVVFDLDGTLVATDRFWLPAAQRGCRRAFRELGLDLPLPSTRAWLRLVGLPLDMGLELVLPELTDRQRRLVMERCEQEEAALLRAGGAALMPGARACLEALAARGVRLAIASNCGRAYLEQVLALLELGPLFAAARCLESPGLRLASAADGGPKAAMVASLLATLRTESAVMVGDRAGDREAAHANGLPHVHFAGGFADEDEGDGAEAQLVDLAELPERLASRRRAVEAIGAELDLAHAASLAVSGEPGAGQELLARDLARFAFEGRGVRRIALDELGPPGEPRTRALAAALAGASRARPVLVIGDDLGGEPGARGAERRLHAVAAAPVRARRLLARWSIPRGPTERSAVAALVERPARPAAGGEALGVDTTSALDPSLRR